MSDAPARDIHAAVVTLADELTKLARIRSAIADYHYALDTRQDANTAQNRAFSQIRHILGQYWVQGEEAARRAQP